MIATRLRLRDFRSYAAADVALGDGLTVVHGANGAGKTNLLEALYFGCTGRSCRTSNEREVVRFDASVARVEVDLRDDEGAAHSLSVGFTPGEAKRIQADGVTVERIDVQSRPLICVFLPDRLELVKGPPALRRSHVDQVVAAMWPGRSATRRAYSQALAQRNALLARVRSGRASASSLPAWDAELARHGIALRDDRASAIELLAPRFAEIAEALGLGVGGELRYKPRSRAADAAGLAAELAEHTASDLERGFTGHGPHRDDLAPAARRPRAARVRLAGRAAPRAACAAARRARGARGDAPSRPADAARRRHERARSRAPRHCSPGCSRGEGQSIITTTDLAHVPGAGEPSVARLAVAGGAVLQDTVAA